MLATPPGAGVVGGQAIVLRELAEQLQDRGWDVETALGWRGVSFHSHLSRGQKWKAALGAWRKALPDRVRRFLSFTSMPRAFYVDTAHNLRAAERQIDASAFDMLMVHVDGAPPGLCALASERAVAKGRPLVFVSMWSLSDELQSFGWTVARRFASVRLGAAPPPTMFQPIRVQRIPLAVFASESWRARAVRAGLPPARTRTIYFGVPLPPPVPRASTAGQRILWVGRLSPEKGLHVLLRALPDLRRLLPHVSVTAIAAQGSPGYRELIEREIRESGLEAVVTVRPSVPRTALAEAYATHDVLFFHSVFDEPVALVLMEAFAAGLPVAASRAVSGARLVRPGETCAAFDVRRNASVVRALHSLLTDEPLRERVTASARQLVEAEFSLQAMGRAYDELLRECLC
jgi:glycosyltransferase involved in cell wall biosynthesis